jgi:hypothetical protein
MIREMTRVEIVGEGCRVSHDAMLCFQQRVHLLVELDLELGVAAHVRRAPLLILGGCS